MIELHFRTSQNTLTDEEFNRRCKYLPTFQIHERYSILSLRIHCDRKLDAEACATAGFTVAVNRPSMNFDDFADCWQSKAATVLFGGKKRVKHSGLRFRSHPFASIDDVEHDSVIASVCLKFKNTTARHRLLSIPRKVRQYLQEQSKVDIHKGQVRRQVRADFYPLFLGLRLIKVDKLFNKYIQIRWFLLECADACELEKVIQQSFQVDALLANRSHLLKHSAFTRGVADSQVFQQQVEIQRNC